MTKQIATAFLVAGVAAWLPLSTLGVEGDAKPKKEGKEGAHKEGPPSVFGEVSAVDATHIELKAKSKEGKGVEAVSVKLTDATTYGSKDKPGQASDIKVGDRVRIAIQKAEDGSMTALKVYKMPPHAPKEGGDKPKKEKEAK